MTATYSIVLGFHVFDHGYFTLWLVPYPQNEGMNLWILAIEESSLSINCTLH
jgi:hypothetical protein